MKYISYKKILSKIDIKKGQIVLLNSDILKILVNCKNNGEIFDPNIFLDTIIKKIGKLGTLLLPTYSFDFCAGKTYNYKKNIPITGYLSRVALKRKDFKRTKHPVHSFVVWGKDKEKLSSLKNIGSYDKKSVFKYLHKNNATNLVIGLDYKESLTIDHYCEQLVGVNYRFNKVFKSNYIDENNKEETRSYEVYVRRNPELSIETGISPLLDEELKKKNAHKAYKINDVKFFLIKLGLACDVMIQDIRNEKKLIFLRKK